MMTPAQWGQATVTGILCVGGFVAYGALLRYLWRGYLAELDEMLWEQRMARLRAEPSEPKPFPQIDEDDDSKLCA